MEKSNYDYKYGTECTLEIRTANDKSGKPYDYAVLVFENGNTYFLGYKDVCERIYYRCAQ